MYKNDVSQHKITWTKFQATIQDNTRRQRFQIEKRWREGVCSYHHKESKQDEGHLEVAIYGHLLLEILSALFTLNYYFTKAGNNFFIKMCSNRFPLHFIKSGDALGYIVVSVNANFVRTGWLSLFWGGLYSLVDCSRKNHTKLNL